MVPIPGSKLKCTNDHRVAFFDDVLNSSKIDYTEAKNLTGKYIVRKPDTNRPIHKESVLYNKDQVSYLVGTLLGVATIGKQGQMVVSHCDAQKDYLLHKQTIFGGNVKEKINSGFDEGKLRHYLYLPINEQTRKLREMFYVDGKKTITNVIDMIDEKSLAIWWCDDGSLNTSSNKTTYNGTLATDNFSYEDNLAIVKMFQAKWNLNPVVDTKKVKYQGEYRSYNRLRFGTEDCKKLSSIVAKHVPVSMEYKLVEECRGGVKASINNTPLNFAASFVTSVEECKNQQLGKLYDIEVEDNHNFFASGTLIHNCQNARQIGYKIWLMPWLKTTHTGSYAFRGDLPAIAQHVGSMR